MSSEDQDLLLNSVQKIRTYAELMVNTNPDCVSMDGNILIRIGAEIIESLNKINSVIK